MAEICCELDCDPALAARAATWLAGFHPTIEVVAEAHAIRLEGCGWSKAELEALWTNALANERLFENAGPFRAAVLRDLVE